MRGKVLDRMTKVECKGITPAYAGKSTWRCMPFVTSQDHPRLCGEKRIFQRRATLPAGSPPPMRGKDGCKGI